MLAGCQRRLGGAMILGLAATFAMTLMVSPVSAQSTSTPSWDLFAGYQWFHPGGNVPAPFGDPTAPTAYTVPDMSKGFGVSTTYNFDPHWGFEGDFGYNWGNDNYTTTLSGGPRFIWRTDGANYFIHTLLSYNRLGVSGLNPNGGIGAVLGGGMDLPITKRVAWRLFEADYVWSRHNYADEATSDFPNLRRPSLEGVRLRTGLVFSWGGAPVLTPSATCTVQPTEVMVGEPITATVTVSNFNPKHTVTYSWSGTGGQVTGKDTTASIETTSATPGSYTITARATDARMKTGNEASCTANFTIKPLPPKNPPTMSCSASSTNVPIGTPATITCSCTSPDGASVSVSNWTASSGTINGNGNTAVLDTTGAPAGNVTVGATCTDSRGLNGQASTQLALQTPPPPEMSAEMKAIEARLYLHSVYFATDQPKIANPRGGLVPSQQKTLLALAGDFQKYLQAKPDAHLVLQGHADRRGTVEYNQALSERRVERTKSFLVENGVPEGSIQTQALGKQHNLTDEEVMASVEQNPELTPEERARVLRNKLKIIMASNRRVDVTLQSDGQTVKSVQQYPFNAADSLTLIGGRESEMKKPVAKKPMTKKPMRKKPAQNQ